MSDVFVGQSDAYMQGYHAAKRENGWVSVKNVMPDKSGYYLCTYCFDGHRFYYDRWYQYPNNKFQTSDKITHWMPLPNPPENEK